MSLKDFSNYFAHAWVTAENPNMDVNCSLRYLVSCFRYCDKKELMVEEDYQFFQQLPDEVRVYRGVTPGHNPKGLSWTLNYEKAAWFSRRFETENEKGYILTAIANKKDILAYFNTRNEDEVVCDTKKLINIERCDKQC